jgi:16S rRNA (cytosine967-C5)-methyltransferase
VAGNVREIAARVLGEAERGRAFVDEVLAAHRTAGLSRRDRALLTALVYGVTRRRRALDWLIDRCAARVDPRLRQHLRVALFQIRYLDRVPRHAAVHEAVELAKGVSRKAAGFVNAVLRRAADLELPESLGVRTSHPDWLIDRWRRRFSEGELRRLLEADNAALPVTARDRRTGAVVELEGDPAEWPGWDEGRYVVQDETSMKAAPLLAPRPGERVLDLAAAPGGKTAHLADLMEGRGLLVAVDLPGRLELVRDTVRRLRLPHVRLVASDGTLVAFREKFDAVLLDAPCSNTGVLARRPDVRWRLRESDIAGAAALQRRLLENAARLLKPGGRLVYSTCSLEPEENRVDVPGLRVLREEWILPTERWSGGYMALAVREGV